MRPGPASTQEIVDAVLAHQHAGDFEGAARRLVANVDRLFEEQPWQSISALLEGFPPESVDLYPGLCFTEGLLRSLEGHLNQALNYMQKAYLLSMGTDDFDTALRACLEMARIYQRKEDFGTARYYVEDAESLLPRLKNGRRRADFNFRLAELCPDIGMLQQSLDHATQALERFREEGEVLGRFRVFRLLAAVYRQLGDYTTAGNMIEIAGRLFTVGDLQPVEYCHILNQQAHLAWYKGDLPTALQHATQLRECADTYADSKQRVYAGVLLGNLHRAMEEYYEAQERYRATLRLAAETGFEGFRPWIDVQWAWLHALTGDYYRARRLIYGALGGADRGQQMSFNIFLAGLDLLEGRFPDAERQLGASWSFYSDSGDGLSVAVIQLLLAYACLHTARPAAAADYLDEALGWFAARNIDYFPHWWHPQIVAEVGTFALARAIHTHIAERMLLKHMGRRRVRILRGLLEREDPVIRQAVADLLKLAYVDFPEPLDHIKHGPVKAALEGLLREGYLRPDGFERLLEKLTTAQQRGTPNPTLAAVFGLYLRGFSRRQIATKLECSPSLVKNYITEIYQIFDLPPEGFDTRRERLERLRELARGEGLV